MRDAMLIDELDSDAVSISTHELNFSTRQSILLSVVCIMWIMVDHVAMSLLMHHFGPIRLWHNEARVCALTVFDVVRHKYNGSDSLNIQQRRQRATVKAKLCKNEQDLTN